MGAEKIFEGAQVNFFLIFWNEDQKKVFYPKLRPVDTFIARRGATESYGADLGSSPQIQGRNTKKKGSSARNLWLRLCVYLRFFRFETRLYSRLGGAKAVI